MEYLHHEESIVLRYGIELVGWTADKFVNPSELSSSLGVLTTLRDALKNGECKWVKLSRDDRRARQAKWDEGVAAGTIIPRARATRSDKGQPRKRKHTEVDNDIDADNETPDGMATVSSGTSSAVPGTTTSPIVTSPPASQAAPGAPAPKRRKTNGVAASPPAAGNKAPRKPRAKPSKENDGAKSGKGKGKGKGKPAAGSKKVRDDETTRKVLVELRARRVAKSRAVILSDDEEDSEPTASTSTTADVPAAPATPATPDAIDPALLTMAAA
jgi:hypothetical protein